jgi:hypothetical protein
LAVNLVYVNGPPIIANYDWKIGQAGPGEVYHCERKGMSWTLRSFVMRTSQIVYLENSGAPAVRIVTTLFP